MILKKNNELELYAKEEQKIIEIPTQYKATKNNDVLNELSQQITILGKYGQYTTERKYNNEQPYCK